MNRDEFIKHLEDTYRECVEIVKKKNQDYAKGDDPFSNFRLSKLISIEPKRAILVRLTDKISRISNLLDKPPAVTEEGLLDTIRDAINYVAILSAFIKDEETR